MIPFLWSGNTLHNNRTLICCRVFVAIMAARFVEAEVKTKTRKEAQTTGQEFFKSGQILGGKKNSLKATKSQNWKKHSRIFTLNWEKKMVKTRRQTYLGWCRVPVFKASVARKGEKATRTKNGKKAKQNEEPDQGRGGDTMRKRSVRQLNPSPFNKYNVVAANNTFWKNISIFISIGNLSREKK